MIPPPFIQDHPHGVYLRIKAQPRASRDEIGEVAGGELKVRVTAPPVDSAANEAVLALLVRKLGCPRGAVQLVRGASSRHKQILVTGMPAAQVAAKLVAKE